MVRATGRCVCVPCLWIGLLFDRSVSALYLRIFVGSRLRENDVAKRYQSRENYKIAREDERPWGLRRPKGFIPSWENPALGPREEVD